MPTPRREHKTLTGKTPTKRENRYKKFKCFDPDGRIYCFCDQYPRLEARRRTCQTNKNGNEGREFWSCANPLEYCDFFLWDDELEKYGHPGYSGSPSDEDGGGECDDFDPRDRRGHRLGDGYITPPPSTQGSPVAGPSTPHKSKKRRVVREPSPDWPDTDAMQAELDKYKQKEREWEKEKTELKQENDSLKLENSRLLAQVYPEVFGHRAAPA